MTRVEVAVARCCTAAGIAAVVALLVAGGRAFAQSSARRPMPDDGVMSATIPVSAVALASFVTKRDTKYLELDLLVLWRGRPGWFMGGDGRRSGGGGSPGWWSTYFEYNGVSHEVQLQYDPRTAHIDGKPVPLGGHNVVLIDDADRGGKMVRLLTVDTTMTQPGMPGQVIGRSPELRAFVRCDVKVENPRTQAMFDRLCDQLGSGR